MHENLFDLLWHGEGRWTWDDVYHMPVFLRRFWIKKLNKIFEEQSNIQQQTLQSIKNQKSRKK